jgi:hypothetical protein
MKSQYFDIGLACLGVAAFSFMLALYMARRLTGEIWRSRQRRKLRRAARRRKRNQAVLSRIAAIQIEDGSDRLAEWFIGQMARR